MNYRIYYFCCIVFLVFVLPATAQNYYYVDALIGSDSLSGTTQAIDIATQTGPKATIEGAIQAAPEGTVTAIYLLSSTYTRDESGVADAMGNAGGNDSDGITVQGNKTIHLILAHPEEVDISSRLEIDLAPGYSLQIRDDVTRVQTKSTLSSGFELNSGSLEWDVGSGQQIFLLGDAIVGEDTRFVLDDRLQMDEGSLDIAAGAEVILRDGMRIGETGFVNNAGRIEADDAIEYSWNGAFIRPLEESNTYLINEPSGVINLNRRGTSIEGPGIAINRGLIRSDTRQSSVNSSQIFGYFFNLGIVEIASGYFRIGEVRTVLDDEEGGQIITGPETWVTINQASMSPNSRFEGEGRVIFDECTFEGTFEFYGELTLSNCQFTDTAQLNHLGNEVNIGNGVSIEPSGEIQFKKLQLNSSTSALALFTDLLVEELEVWGLLSGPGNITVESSMEWEQGTIEGPGRVILNGNGFSSRSSMTIQSELVIAEDASFVVNMNELDGDGKLVVEEGASVEILYLRGASSPDTLTIENAGSIQYTSRSPSSVLVGHVVNRGLFSLGDGSSFQGLGRTLVVHGRFTNESGGVLTGVGELDISQAMFINHGEINPGRSDFPGQINIIGDLILDDMSNASFDVFFFPDLIHVDGAINFGGALNIVFPSEENPRFDFEQPLFTSTSSTGSFEDIDVQLPARFGDATASVEQRSDTLMLVFSGYNVNPVAVDDSLTITEGDTVLIDVKANDFDPLGDTLYVTVNPTPRIGIFDNGTPDDRTDDLIRYTATQQTAGEDRFSYAVRDNKTGFDSGSVIVTIVGVDDSLAFVDYPLRGASVGLPYEHLIIARDVDDQDVTLMASELPSWLSLVDSDQRFGQATGRLVGTPGTEDVGTHAVKIAGTSSTGTFFHEFMIEVLPDGNLQPPFDAEINDFAPLFTWDTRPGIVSYQFQLAEEGRISDAPLLLQRTLIDSSGITQPQFTIPPDLIRSQQSYDWRVGYLSDQGILNWSGISSFSIPAQGPLPAPVIVGPADGETNLSLPVSFLWEKIAGNSGYRIEISTDSTFISGKKLAGGRDIVDSEFAEGLFDQLVGGTRYYWRVAGRNEAGDGMFSPTRSFTTQPVSRRITSLPIETGELYWAEFNDNSRYDALIVSRDTFRTALHLSDFRGVELDAEPAETGLPDIMGTAAWGDYDADGDPDLILAGMDASGSVATRVYSLHEGEFTRASFALPPVRSVVEWGRFDLDLDYDLLLSDVDEQGDGVTYVLTREGEAFNIQHVFDLGGVAQFVDFDQDGDNDILVGAGMNSTESGLQIYRNDQDSLLMIFEIDDVNIGGVAFGDFDVDGDQDVVITGKKSEQPITLFYLYNGSEFVVEAHSLVPSKERPSWTDLDHDADLDLFIPGDKEGNQPSRVYINTDGEFEDFSLTTLEGIDVEGYSWTDIDLDGDHDLVISGKDSSGHTLQVWDKYTERIVDRVPDPGRVEIKTSSLNSITFTWTMPEQRLRPLELMRYIVEVRSQSTNQLLSPTHIDGVSFSARLFIPGAANAGPAREFTINGLSPDSTYSVRVHAVDLYDNLEYGTFQRTSNTFQFSTMAGISDEDESLIAPADLDGDGDVDAFHEVSNPGEETRLSFFKQENNRFFETETNLGLLSVNSFDVGDYDNDNDLDILMDGLNNTMGVYINEEGFSPDNFMALDEYRGAVYWWDIDQDNDLDVVAMRQDELFVYLSESGVLASEPDVFDLGFSLGGRVVPGDYDNDGDLDFYAPGQHLSALVINENNQFRPIFSGISDKTSTAAAWGDYDNDGDLDIVVWEDQHNTSRLHLYENKGGLFVSKMFLGDRGDGGRLAWGDIDNDGDLDLMAPERFQALLFYNEGDHFVKQENAYPVTFGGRLIQNAPIMQDIDGDHDVDLIYRNYMLRNRPNALKNKPPTPPQELDVEILEGGTKARLTWSEGSDDTTPSKALTYNVRVGNESGQGDIVSPMSILEGPQEGWRMRYGMGNAGKRREYIVNNLQPGTTYFWSVQAQDNSFAGGPFSEEIPFTTNGISIGVEDEANGLTFDLFQNYPNPFNPSTTLRFSISEVAEVKLEVYDILGRRVAQLVNGTYNPGYHEIQWQADRYASGLYFAHMEANAFTKVVKMVLVK